MKNKEQEQDKFILAQTREWKLKWLEDILESDKFGLWLALTRILLKYPISEGGIATEDIDAIFQRHLNSNKDNSLNQNQLNSISNKSKPK